MIAANERREQVRERYAVAAQAVRSGSGSGVSCCGPADALSTVASTDQTTLFGANLYDPTETDALPHQAVLASLGCGDPLAVAELRDGETVLDLGCGGGIDVLLSAKRVGPSGFAYGLDMTDEMLDLARANASRADTSNVEFLKGQIEAIPLADSSIDVIISNCVVNLSTDKPAVLAEMFRVLVPGGRVGISDVVAEDQLAPSARAERGSYVGCIAGALSVSEYLDGLSAAGFTDPQVQFTHEVASGMHGAVVRATKPVADSCCAPADQAACCQPSDKAACCGAPAAASTDPASPCGCR